ncbi:peptide MFS transporter [Herbiconiux sp. L3-i23]|uniref:peptide MFS transporter n=1 Tax=Herbiconiux sp. L3-i23 TaxID=2905871 RepID=UPI00206360A9|nr:oligopeptide:H+ symporter [Herbiconiux sp. L3-i23]BDI22445.1 MFS transporter [Herbiconiux sp. L3-i23]
MSEQQTAPERHERTFFGQPWSLSTIFGVELWERFSFYGMQGILLIYLYFSVADGGLGVPRDAATSIVGAYGGAVYLATVLGAWLADRVVGAERMLFASAVTVMLGHIALALLPGGLGVVVGLILIALGSGGVKATATSIVGTLYEPGDIRREAGFSLYYLGINLGAFVGPLLTGLLQSTVGFHFGFGLAAVGMAVGLTQYAIGRRRLPAAAAEIPNPLPRARRLPFALIAVAGIAIIVVLVASRLVTEENLSTVVAALIAAASVAYFITLLSSRRISTTERSRVVSFIPLFVASTAFWSLYQQQFTVLTIYSDDRLDRSLFGWEMPISWVQSINPVFIILLSGVFAALWTRLGTRQPTTPVKFALGTIVMGAAFLLFLPFVGTGPHGTPLLAIVGILFVFTVAELLLSPVGLSASTKLAPELFRTQMVALNFLSVGLGTAIAGTLAGFYDETNEAPYFGISGAIAIILGVALWLGSRAVLRLMRGVR